IRSEFEQFWISLELEKCKIEKAVQSPEEFHAREYLDFLEQRFLIPTKGTRNELRAMNYVVWESTCRWS
ncbi:hypothetical protein TNCT_573041, partial [Trichonephila clavata]